MQQELSKIDELTNSGDLASCFQYQEQLNSLTKKAMSITLTLAQAKDGNTLLLNTLEFKMKAAGDIAEYQQAQTIKEVIEVPFLYVS